MMDKLEKWLMPLASAIGRNKFLIAIRDGFLVSTPLLIAGSIFLLLANFPITAWVNFVENWYIGDLSFASLLSKPEISAKEVLHDHFACSDFYGIKFKP